MYFDKVDYKTNPVLLLPHVKILKVCTNVHPSSPCQMEHMINTERARCQEDIDTIIISGGGILFGVFLLL